MALTYGFYNSVKGDRKYDAMQFSEIIDTLIIDGIIPSKGQLFAVTTAGNGMQINVGTGMAWFFHSWTKNDSVMVLTVEESDITRPRIDAVVLEVNREDAVRANLIKIVKGEPNVNAEKPTLVTTAKVHQYPLAWITVPAAAEEIKAENIENAVGLTPTVFATGILDTAPLDDLWNQWEGEWDTWFAAIKLQLSGDVVANLQGQIEEKVDKADKATSADATAGTSDEKWMTPALTKQMIGESEEIGDIKWSTKNLAEETNGKYMLCNGALINLNSYPDYKDSIGAKYGINISYSTYNYYSDFEISYGYLSSNVIGMAKNGNGVIIACAPSNLSVLVQVNNSTPVYLSSASGSSPIFCFYLNTVPICVYNNYRSNTSTLYYVYVANCYKPTDPLTTTVETGVTQYSNPSTPWKALYVTNSYALVYIGRGSDTETLRTAHLLRITCTSQTVKPAAVITDLSAIISLGMNSYPICIAGDLYYKDAKTNTWTIYKSATGTVLQISDSSVISHLNIFFNNYTDVVTYGEGFVSHSGGGILYFDQETGMITGAHHVRFYDSDTGSTKSSVDVILPTNAIAGAGNILVCFSNLASTDSNFTIKGGAITDKNVILNKMPLTTSGILATQSFPYSFMHIPSFNKNGFPMFTVENHKTGSYNHLYIGRGSINISSYAKLPLAMLGTPNSLTTPFVKVRR